ncbi:hypothetical protein Dimus_010749, partial [Dionaea muscipula]
GRLPPLVKKKHSANKNPKQWKLKNPKSLVHGTTQDRNSSAPGEAQIPQIPLLHLRCTTTTGKKNEEERQIGSIYWAREQPPQALFLRHKFSTYEPSALLASYGFQTAHGYAVADGRPVRERRLPCCGIDIGWSYKLSTYFPFSFHC